MEIRHLDEIVPLIEGRKDFVTKRADGYIAVDYAIQLFDTFDDPRRVEIRGLKFHPDGEIMARPLHKFFNLGERADLQVLSLDAEHVIMDKLDGSMVHGAMLRDGSTHFMTRMGMTDVARKAERHLTLATRAALADMLHDGITPIFEFTAPDNRIVVKYAESGLTLLALRETVSGRYLPRDEMERVASILGVPTVRVWAAPASPSELVDTVRALKGAEGIVISFASGPWLKIKGEEYALMHKAKDSITREKNVLAVLLDGAADDLRPLLTEEDRKPFDEYAERLSAAMTRVATQVQSTVDSGAHLNQKAFAVEHLGDAPAWLRPLAFQVRSGRVTALEAVRHAWRKQCGSQADVDELRPLLGFDWNGPIIE